MTDHTADFRFSPPVHIEAIPDGSIETIGQAAGFLRRHRDGEIDIPRDVVLGKLENARTVEEQQAAAEAFLAWLDAEGLVPEDQSASH
jgi:hypothetical protein